MAGDYPTVLFVDEDREALDRISLRCEPVFLAIHLHSPGALDRYLDDLLPDVVVLSDRLEHRKQDCRAILARLRAKFPGPIIVLGESTDGRERALWRERGATEFLLHPTRFEGRLDALTRTILRTAIDEDMKRRKEGEIPR